MAALFRSLLGKREARPALPQEVRFITSFNPAFYEASGRRCARTFCEHNPDYGLTAYVEGEPDVLSPLRGELDRLSVESIDLATLPLLADFLTVAHDLIPQELGGTAPPEMFPGEGPDSGDVWFRKHMYRWFRKIVALDHASRNFHGVLIWMDCDCFFKAPLPRDVLERAFGGADVFYMKGSRKVSETGMVGYDLSRGAAREFVDGMKAHYMERRFPPYPRWDDSFTFDHVRAGRKTLVCRDIGRRARERGHILCTTLLAPYLEHDKGLHSRKMGLVR